MKKSFTQKALKCMKICFWQMVVILNFLGVTMAHSNFAQALDQQISIRMVDVPFEQALMRIEQAAKIKFAYSSNQLRNEKKVSLESESRTLRDVLDELFLPRKITYKFYEKEHTITLKKSSARNEKQGFYYPDGKSAGPVQLTGIVVDAVTREGLPGVNIIVKGTARGTTTDSQGKFALEADPGDVLLFSFIGYAPATHNLSYETVIEISMQEDVTTLKAVEINAGYYTTTKEAQTGNIVKVESTDIQRQPVSNALATLQGRVPGLEIIQQTGVPGGNFKVRIRGTNSLTNGNDPLYIIDGVPFISNTLALRETSGEILGSSGSNPLNSINPSDIESIEVLKDADATAIYGSRGSNGVILISTRKGKAGNTSLSTNFYTGVGRIGSRMKLLGSDQYLAMRRQAFANDGVLPTQANAPDLLLRDTTHNTDWQNELIGGSASIVDAQISISGGEKNTQFSIGTGLHRETTVFPGSNSDKRVSAHARITNASNNQKFKTSVSVSYSFLSSDLFSTDLTSQALLLSPTAPKALNEDGTLSWGPASYTSSFMNPLAYLKRSYESTNKNLFGNATISYELASGLELKSNLGYTDTQVSATTLIPVSSYDPADAAYLENTTIFSGSTFQNWIIEPQLNWHKALQNSKINFLIGSTFLDQKNSATAQYAAGFSSEALMKNLAASTNRFISQNTFSEYRYHALFLRANYAYKEKYIVNLTGRRDGSSRFGADRRFATFGAVGLAWIFSKESMIERSLPFISFGKLRTSYGITGNDQLGDYQYLDTYAPSGQYHNTIGLSPTRLNNPDFAWETNRKFELGMALGFFNERIHLDASYYRNRSSNQLIGSPLPPTTGFSTIQSNFPATIQNSGIELLATFNNVERANFSWSTSVNFTAPKNELISFPDLAKFPSSISDRYVEGEPVTITKRYNFIGIDPVNGLHRVDDNNGDGRWDQMDRTALQYVGQKFYGGLQNSFRFYGFELDIMLQYSKQTGFNYFANIWNMAPGAPYNFPREVMDRWEQEGDDAGVQKFSTLAESQLAYDRYTSSNQAVTDASFVRLKNVALSYSISKPFIEKMGMHNARIYAQGQNLLTITKYKGVDPETQNSSLPPLQVWTAGIQLTF